jgi:NAD+ synthase (glutamine-hydrolysing)
VIDAHPFVPGDREEKSHRCEEITDIQAHGLIKRMTHAHIQKAVIGISGGLDSTLALLSTHKAFKIMQRDAKDIIAVTMPGFGTTSRTKSNAIKLCEALGVTLKEVDITELSLKEFDAIGHDRDEHSVTYENVQARARTSILMNMANREGGLVIGTGDLSEIALGWSTYNGDHMSMYALNSGIPKTLIQYVIEYFGEDEASAPILHDILEPPISPELLPHDEDSISQETEEIVGPYELHDFFLYHIIKYGAKPSKVLFLARKAFDGKYDKETIKKWLTLFIKRFFTQQFKRSCMPDGPKVGTINLSPRADWRMPSDADMKAWLAELELQ